MNTKVDLNNLENENIVNIAHRMGVLSEDSGDVFLWFVTHSLLQLQKPSAARKTQRSMEFLEMSFTCDVA